MFFKMDNNREEKIEKVIKPLLSWFQKNKRILPWREDKNPYHVWISEIMLQQTRIEAVKEYYARFMKELPDVKSLATISEEKLLKLWEGLGYYSRAKNLKKAAMMIESDYGGEMPHHFEELRKLPGIGDYTAGAISSICFNEKVTAVDGNVLRVISRIIGSKKDVLLPETKKEVEQMLLKVIPSASGDFNEGLMELGETICVPNGEPLCEKCPLRKSCFACENHMASELPVRIKKVKRKQVEKTVFLFITKEGKVAIEKREEKGLLSGMYQFPNVDAFLDEKAIKENAKKWNLKVNQIAFLKDAKHVFTHIDWYMKGFKVLVEAENEKYLWVSMEELKEKYALPTAFQKML